jgi:serine/threonine protein kinase/WD40 repeat protein
MGQVDAERKTLEVLAEDFVARYRRGERPALSEYIAAHPELANEIRELFPTLVMMEELAPSDYEASNPTTTTPSQPPLLSLGDYRILREIGRGGMGVVYEAEQLSLGRRVALKVLRYAAADGTVRQRFHREARAAAQLHHTNIVPVYEVGENRDDCWYAMQLILGQGLDEIIEELRQQRLPAGRTDFKSVPPVGQVTQSLVTGQFACPDLNTSTPSPASSQTSIVASGSTHIASRSELSGIDSAGDQYYRSVARIGRQAAEGLAYAHARGIIHRDIKPSNLLLDTAGVVWITDFGLAKTQDSNLTTTGDIVGTLRYMAPERFKGEGDERADVYGLGLTLHELLVLRPAFESLDRLDLIDRIKNHEPVRLRFLDRRIPRDLETILLKAIDKDAKRRYQSAEALAEDLRRFLADEPIAARRTSELERLRLWARRNPAVAILSIGIALLLLLLSLVSTVAALWLNRMTNEARRSEHVAIERLIDASLTQARAGRTSRTVGQRFDSWKALAQAAESARILQKGTADWLALRNEAIACLTLPDLRLDQEWEGNPAGTNGLAFDSHFDLYAWSYKDDGVRIRRVRDHQQVLHLPVLTADTPDPWRDLQFSPDGQFFSIWYRYHTLHQPAQLWELKEGVTRPRLTISDVCCEPLFMPQGCVAVGLAEKSLAFYNLETRKETRRLPLGFSPQKLALSCDGQRLAVSCKGQSKIEIRQLVTGEVIRSLPHPAEVQAIAWHPDGSRVATGCDDHCIYIWEVGGNKPPSVLEGHRWEVYRVAFDPSGGWLLSFSWDMTVRLWDVRLRKQLLSLPNSRAVGIRRDDRLMVATLAGPQVQLWDCVPSPAYRVLYGHQRSPHFLEFSPDGRWLASAGWDPFFCIWDMATGRELARQVEKCVEGLGVLWEPAGDGLLTYSGNGLRRWPIRSSRAAGKAELSIGPSQLLLPPIVGEGGRLSLFGKEECFLGVCCRRRGRFGVIQFDNSPRELWTQPFTNVNYISGSPDGRWVATGTFEGGNRVCVWDRRTGRLEKDWPIGDAEVAFSPDGRWLAAATGRNSAAGAECRTWRVGSWEPGPHVLLDRMSSSPPSLAFTPDGKILAVVHTSTEVRLLNADTLEDIAILSPPDSVLITRVSFSRDGSQLVAAAHDYIQLWDLRVVRRRLKELSLDWDAPPLPAASTHTRDMELREMPGNANK